MKELLDSDRVNYLVWRFVSSQLALHSLIHSVSLTLTAVEIQFWEKGSAFFTDTLGFCSAQQIPARIKYVYFSSLAAAGPDCHLGLYHGVCETDRGTLLVPHSDYRETAARLQKEWRVQAPHKHFDFAPHVNTYALVTLLQKGLIYEDYHRQFAGSQQVR